MALIHRLIRRGFEQAIDFVVAAGATARAGAIAEYVGFHLDGLDAHHSTEDEMLWPALSERAKPSAELIGRMEAQHQAVHEAIATTRRELLAWQGEPTEAGSGSLATALGAVVDRLAEHLAEEERDVVPLIASHISQEEWDRLGKTAFSKFTPKQRFTAMGEMLEAADPTEAARMLAGLPAPIKVVWRLLGRKKYLRFMAAARG
jgi:hemerythrin-like domain-containing protein